MRLVCLVRITVLIVQSILERRPIHCQLINLTLKLLVFFGHVLVLRLFWLIRIFMHAKPCSFISRALSLKLLLEIALSLNVFGVQLFSGLPALVYELFWRLGLFIRVSENVTSYRC